jgi:hypothetical protein
MRWWHGGLSELWSDADCATCASARLVVLARYAQLEDCWSPLPTAVPSLARPEGRSTTTVAPQPLNDAHMEEEQSSRRLELRTRSLFAASSSERDRPFAGVWCRASA